MNLLNFRFFKAMFNIAILITCFVILNTQILAVGVLDTNFGNGGRIAVDFGGFTIPSPAAAVDSNDKILVLASVQLPGQTYLDVAVARLNKDGSLDTTFGTGGRAITKVSAGEDFANAIALQPDGKIIVVGQAEPTRQTLISDFFIVRYNTDGSLDTGFGNNGILLIDRSETDVLYDVAVQPDGKIVVVGTTTANGGEGAILRFNPNGSPDASFGTGGAFYLPTPATTIRVVAGFHKINLLADGRILVGGFFQTQPQTVGIFSLILALFDNTGKLVDNFGNQGITRYNGTISPPRLDIAVLPDGQILAVAGKTVRFTGGGVFDTVVSTGNNRGSVTVNPENDKYIITNFPISNSPPADEIRLFSRDNRLIGRASNISTYEAAFQSNGKIILYSPDTSGNGLGVIVSRLLSITSLATRLADFDSDDQTDFAVFRPANRVLYILRGANYGFLSFSANTNVTRVIPESFIRLPYRSVTPTFVYWQAASSAASPAFFHTVSNAGEFAFQWGLSDDIPVGGDYDGDTQTDYTVFRPSNGVWYIVQSSDNQMRGFQWGKAGDKPVPADYDYDGITDFAIYRPSEGTWYIHQSSDGKLKVRQFGISTDIPLTGDFDGDGRADFVVYRPSEGIWYLLTTSTGFYAARFGLSTDIPVPGDYDGDGRHDIAVYREGIWYILGSTRGFYAVQWGLASDIPAAVRYAY